ncbi:MAG: sirohydrochlorin chelatase [Acidimicrobiales bacterium]
MVDVDAVMLVAHGSRSATGQHAMTALAADVALAFPSVPVQLGFLELSEPPAHVVLDDVLSGGARRIVVVPLMLHAAGHSKSDIPALVVVGRLRHPGVELLYARPFGADHVLLDVARSRLEAAGGTGLPLAVLARGTSDPDANAEAYRIARLVAEVSRAPLVAPGFSGVTWPDVRAALDQLRRLGARRVAAFAWYLATGVLLDRMHEDFDRFTADTGIEVVDAGYLGTGPEVVKLVLDRVEEAANGRAVPNCDACAYRRPFPGLEDRVGQAVGVGHSHLAADHRHGVVNHAARSHGHEHLPVHDHDELP